MTDTAPPPTLITLGEIASLCYRRRVWLIVPAIVGLLLAIGGTLLLRPSYRSSATLLIDSQQISTSVIASPLTNYADERVAKIRQQVTSRRNLDHLIRVHRLYAEERRTMPDEAVQAIMQSAIGVDLVGARPKDRQESNGNTIAFTLSFTYRDPRVAQQVTQALTTLFLSADKRLRTEQATGAASFLDRRAQEVRNQLVDLEAKRRTIEARYAGALPEQIGMTAQTEASLRAEVSRIDSETQGLLQQNSLLAVRGQEVATARPSDDGVHRAEERLAQLSAIYEDGYPEVVAARAALDRQRALAMRRGSGNGSTLLNAEIAAGHSRIGALSGRRAALIGAIADVSRRTALAPQASYELNNLSREYDSLKTQYQDIREKQMEAQVAANLQVEDKGERFSVVDPPSLSFTPLGPAPLQLILAGLAGGLGTGLALMMLWQIFVGPINGQGKIVRILGAPPLVTVPMLMPISPRAWAFRTSGMSSLIALFGRRNMKGAA